MFVCSFGLKIRRSVGRFFFLSFFFFFPKSGCRRNAIPFVCVHSWACRTSELKLILVLKGGCIPLYLVKELFWDSYKKFYHFIWTFLLKMQNRVLKQTNKQKKADPFANFLGQSTKRANKHFFKALWKEIGILSLYIRSKICNIKLKFMKKHKFPFCIKQNLFFHQIKEEISNNWCYNHLTSKSNKDF